MTVAALIVAAGRGSRAGEGLPKQYRSLAGETILARTLRPFLNHPQISRIVVVIHPDHEQLYGGIVTQFGSPDNVRLASPAHGGQTRQDSVHRGLEALAGISPEIVLVHDAARPFIDSRFIDRAIAAGRAFGAAVPGTVVTDTVKVVDDQGKVMMTPDRATLRAVQTPQAFSFDVLLGAHRRADSEDLHGFTDDGALAEWAGLPVFVFEGHGNNVKITHEADIQAAGERLRGSAMTYLVSLGTGFDVHAFTHGDHVWLGGVKIPHDCGVLAHSDGDVVLHALTDAVFGALADGDIGTHFPPSDPQWRGASSDRFLSHAVALVRQRGGFVDHLDATLMCERPKLGPHREAMRVRIAEIAGIRIDQVSVKATTTEKLGFTGRSEGLAAQAAATIRLPEAGS